MDGAVLKLLCFAVVLTRVSVFLMVIPIFNSTAIPARIKVCIVLLVSVFLAISMPQVVDPDQLTGLRAVLLIVNEAIYGAGLGMIVDLIFSIVKIAARIIEREMGFAFADTLDPMSGETVEPLSILIEMIFILLFLAANGHHMLLLIISKSYETFPAGHVPDLTMLVDGIVKSGTIMLSASLRLAAPMLATFLLLLVVLGVFARILPEMDILFISMPLRIGLGLLMIGMLLPFINQFTSEFADWMGKLLPI